MKGLFVLLLASFFCTPLSAQSAQADINAQVWIPFLEAYQKGDAALFMSVHSAEVLRVPQDDQKILRYEDYSSKCRW